MSAEWATHNGQMLPHSVEAEQAVLGSLLVGGSRFWAHLGGLTASDFYLPPNGEVFAAMQRLVERQQKIDLITVSDELRAMNADIAGDLAYVTALATQQGSFLNIESYALTVREQSNKRRAKDVSDRLAIAVNDPTLTSAQIVEQARAQLEQIAGMTVQRDYRDMTAVMSDVEDQLATAQQHTGAITGLESGIPSLDTITTGFQPSDLILLAARTSVGKAQPVDAKVLTESGWSTMGKLKVGDKLASIDGLPSEVLGVFPQGEKPAYRVTFSDGRSAECCDEHLWSVSSPWFSNRVISTKDLIEYLKKKRTKNRVWIDLVSGDFGNDQELPLDPWVLGAYIGDGHSEGSSVKFTNPDAQIVERMQEVLGPEYRMTTKDDLNYRIRREDSRWQKGVSGVVPNKLKTILVQMGLFGKQSHEKFIPADYLEGSRSVRVRLLQGLLDTDGTVGNDNGAVTYSTASHQLAVDVVTLARSLGGVCRWTVKDTHYTVDGIRHEARPSYSITISHPNIGEFLTLEKKLSRVKTRQRNRHLSITSIEPSRTTETQCILVSHPKHLYITDDYVVTHNTSLAVHIVHHLAVTQNLPVAIISIEMSAEQVAQRLLSRETGVEMATLRGGRVDESTWNRIGEGVATLANAPIWIDDDPAPSLTTVQAKTKRLHDRVGLSMVVVDYLQLMHGPRGERRTARHEEVATISRGLKAMARDLNLPVLALAQLNRTADESPNQVPKLSQLREAGSLEQDADVVMFLHRPDADMDRVLQITVAKHRNGQQGATSVVFLSQRMTLGDMAHADSVGEF